MTKVQRSVGHQRTPYAIQTKYSGTIYTEVTSLAFLYPLVSLTTLHPACNDVEIVEYGMQYECQTSIIGDQYEQYNMNHGT